MKEFKRIGTPEAIEDAQKKISRYLTGTDNASQESIERGFEEIYEGALEEPASIPIQKEEPVHPYLADLEYDVMEWEHRLTSLKDMKLTPGGTIILAQKVYAEILEKEKEHIHLMEQELTETEDELLSRLYERLSNIKKEILELLFKLDKMQKSDNDLRKG